MVLSFQQRCVIFGTAFLGWLFAGSHMSITQMAGQPAAIDLLDRVRVIDAEELRSFNARLKSLEPGNRLSDSERAKLDRWKPIVARWFTWFQCAFLFGAATGGFCFGLLGDRLGRSKAMAASIITYSGFAAVAFLAQSPMQFWVVWFLASTGVGGMWPNGVALIAEAWSNLSRPMLAGLIGTSANIGIFAMSTLGTQFPISDQSWRWVLIVGSAPLILGIIAYFVVSESPKWLESRKLRSNQDATIHSASSREFSGLFRPPILAVTIVAILLGTVPIIGGWGTANWMNPWADATGDPTLKAEVGQARAITGIVGSLMGGWIASVIGRKLTYFFTCVVSMGLAQYIFRWVAPTDDFFLVWVAALGFANGIFFGWLPLCLPEMFPTRVRSAGAGVGFNFGRIATAALLFVSGGLMEFFHGDYARIGQLTSCLFVLGIVGICFAPKMPGHPNE